MPTLELPVALALLREAFAPLRCVAELYDYNSKIRFRVFGQFDEPLLRVEKLSPHEVEDVASLANLIATARSRLTENGIALRVWSMPHLEEQRTRGLA